MSHPSERKIYTDVLKKRRRRAVLRSALWSHRIEIRSHLPSSFTLQHRQAPAAVNSHTSQLAIVRSKHLLTRRGHNFAPPAGMICLVYRITDEQIYVEAAAFPLLDDPRDVAGFGNSRSSIGHIMTSHRLEKKMFPRVSLPIRIVYSIMYRYWDKKYRAFFTYKYIITCTQNVEDSWAFNALL